MTIIIWNEKEVKARKEDLYINDAEEEEKEEEEEEVAAADVIYASLLSLSLLYCFVLFSYFFGGLVDGWGERDGWGRRMDSSVADVMRPGDFGVLAPEGECDGSVADGGAGQHRLRLLRFR